jgi:sulfate adenylyltransferase large subunit
MAARSLLRFSTAGSVDDGKSTLIGRLLLDCRSVDEDQLEALRASKVNHSTGPLDLSLLTDGLRAEREQGITIDVAYRYFSTPRRSFIIADTPGHEQYTRNMATGASTAEAAVILADARRGLLPQSRRHAVISRLLGIRHCILAVNKMDLVDFDEQVFRAIAAEFGAFAAKLGWPPPTAIPVSALLGDNVVARGSRVPWYAGPTLMEALEAVPVGGGSAGVALRFPVQTVIRPDLHFRGFAGRIASGTMRPGDPVIALPSGRTTRIRSLPSWGGELAAATAGASVTVCLEDEIDLGRGDMLVDPHHLPAVARQFEASVIWMQADALEPERPLLIKHTTQTTQATLRVRARLDVDTLASACAGRLELNEIGTALVETSRPLFIDPYEQSRATGSFILIDPISNATLGAGMITRATEVAARWSAASALQQIEFSATRISPAERRARFGHFPAVVWLVGRLELAYALECRLFQGGCVTHVITSQAADPIRSSRSAVLGARTRILPETAAVLCGAGLIVICSAPSSDRDAVERARSLVGGDRFLLVDPAELEADDAAAARRVLRALEARGILGERDEFVLGEGI